MNGFDWDLWFCECMIPGEYDGLVYSAEYGLNKYLGLLWLSFKTLVKYTVKL